jgi:hypothetical protein
MRRTATHTRRGARTTSFLERGLDGRVSAGTAGSSAFSGSGTSAAIAQVCVCVCVYVCMCACVCVRVCVCVCVCA